MLAAVREGLSLLPAAARRPAVLGRWLARAHRAQLALGLFLVLALFVVPPVLDRVFYRLYPPVETRDRLLGIFERSTTRPDPRFEARLRQVTVLIWCLGLGGVAALLLAALPRAVARARLDTLEARVVPDDELRALSTADTVIDAAATSCVGAGNRYRLTKELGRGGMGIVYHALDTSLEREVALKELPPHLCAHSELARRFRQEARLLAQLAHPCIVQVHDLIEDRGRLWIALELIRGGTLDQAMARHGGALPWQEVVRLGAQLAEGLAFAHGRGVIHRDIKPINVLLTDGDPACAKLTDFGLARLVESSEHTQQGTLLGSARYMSPEQAAGQPAHARSDIYSLGITLFEALCGRAPFEGEVVAVLAQHLSGTPPALGELCPGLPPALETLVMSMISRAAEHRPTADSVVRVLNEIAPSAPRD